MRCSSKVIERMSSTASNFHDSLNTVVDKSCGVDPQ